jgi:flagellar protein FlaF
VQHAVQTHDPSAPAALSPRELEASLLLTAAARLQRVRDGWEGTRPQLAQALLYNRKLWSIFAASVSSDDSQLPVPLRQNVANIGVFVFKQTLTAMLNPKPDNIEPLISINRELAAGLLNAA